MSELGAVVLALILGLLLFGAVFLLPAFLVFPIRYKGEKALAFGACLMISIGGTILFLGENTNFVDLLLIVPLVTFALYSLVRSINKGLFPDIKIEPIDKDKAQKDNPTDENDDWFDKELDKELNKELDKVQRNEEFE